MKKLRIGILGATGMVGQRFATLLENHPWFDVVSLAASPTSAGKTYEEVVSGRWKINDLIPEKLKNMILQSVEEDMDTIAGEINIAFSALDMEKEDIKKIEEEYAAKGVAVISNNSAHRWTPDVPMIIPEVNAHHVELIHFQRKNRGWKNGFIAVKPNCSIQSYVAILTALKQFKPVKVSVVNLQAISGAGKTFTTWPEMVDNVIPFISDEEEKSEKEPLKIWGEIEDGQIKVANLPVISASCIRVPVTNGHLVSISVAFERKPTKEQILEVLKQYQSPIEYLHLPSAPKEFIRYCEEENRPQTKLDRDFEHGMGITMGRLREDTLFDFKFITLSHNTIRGAAGGAILLAELLMAKGYL